MTPAVLLRPIRIFLAGLSFVIFFAGSIALGVLFFPLLFVLALGDRDRHRTRCTRFVGRGYGTFLFWLKLCGFIGWKDRIELPPELRGRPFVLIANHPSLIDVTYFLNGMPGLTCLVKREWYDSLVFGAVLRSTHYIPSPGPAEAAAGGGLDRIAAHVKSGHPLMIFPEGTRSTATSMRRFRRGAFEIAKRCEVPLVRVFIALDRPMLMKGVPFWRLPSGRATWRFELLEIVDTKTDPRSAEELARDAQADYQQRFARWVAAREERHFGADEPVAQVSP